MRPQLETIFELRFAITNQFTLGPVSNQRIEKRIGDSPDQRSVP